MTSEVSHNLFIDDKRLITDSNDGKIAIRIIRESEKNWNYCKYCYEKSPTFILTEETYYKHELINISKMRCCWQCGSGIKRIYPHIYEKLSKAVPGSLIIEEFGKTHIAVFKNSVPIRMVTPCAEGFTLWELSGVDEKLRQTWKVIGDNKSFKTACAYLNGKGAI